MRLRLRPGHYPDPSGGALRRFPRPLCQLGGDPSSHFPILDADLAFRFSPRYAVPLLSGGLRFHSTVLIVYRQSLFCGKMSAIQLLNLFFLFAAVHAIPSKYYCEVLIIRMHYSNFNVTTPCVLAL